MYKITKIYIKTFNLVDLFKEVCFRGMRAFYEDQENFSKLYVLIFYPVNTDRIAAYGIRLKNRKD